MLIDTSVVVRFFSKEPGWESVKEYLTEPLSIELSMIELGSALLEKVRGKELNEKEAIEVLEGYPKNFRFVEEKTSLVKAFEIAKQYNTSMYDAMFIATALKNNLELVTCDNYQATNARKVGVKAIVPGAEQA